MGDRLWRRLSQCPHLRRPGPPVRPLRLRRLARSRCGGLAERYTAPLNPEFAAARFQGPGAHYAIPVFLESGAYDRRADPGLAAQFIADISAPAKAFVSFPNSAHNPPFEEPEAFRDLLVKAVRPLAPPHRRRIHRTLGDYLAGH
jgi:pimeloyl-ACP methyl ester carboxylesterase